MHKTNYFCIGCYKTYTQYYNGSFLCDKNGNPTSADDPMTTGRCNNADQTNPLIQGAICNGVLKVD